MKLFMNKLGNDGRLLVVTIRMNFISAMNIFAADSRSLLLLFLIGNRQ